ncbi:UNKNOWN [Stylonychia lemnae]|uniref:Uncharacterized protein n=1 Tax=Stylonychia lemnae TaxID=5949 RepID=A0A077ZWX9_STYLE|nr:UNKNOWN [Stylonychia lemnae]|eukprot:CDW74360.1 UNKNOWN [Stylonychia lemnae]
MNNVNVTLLIDQKLDELRKHESFKMEKERSIGVINKNDQSGIEDKKQTILESIFKKRSQKIFEQMCFKKRIKAPLLPIGILNFTWHTVHEIIEKQNLNINVPETFYYLDGECYFMRTNAFGIVEKRKINPQLDSRILVEQLYQTTQKMQKQKVSISGCLFPIMIAKITDVFENDVSLQFFLGSCLDKQQSELGKSTFIMQRYIVSKGLGCNVIRVNLTKEKGVSLKNAKLQYYRIGSNHRYDGEDLKDKDQGMNVKRIQEMIKNGRSMKFIKRFVLEQNQQSGTDRKAIDLFLNQKFTYSQEDPNQEPLLVKDDIYQFMNVMQQEQVMTLAKAISRLLKKQRLELNLLSMDFIQDENDQQFYLVQIKYVETSALAETQLNLSRQSSDKVINYIEENKIMKHDLCEGDYCQLEDDYFVNQLPKEHKDFIYLFRIHFRKIIDLDRKIRNIQEDQRESELNKTIFETSGKEQTSQYKVKTRHINIYTRNKQFVLTATVCTVLLRSIFYKEEESTNIYQSHLLSLMFHAFTKLIQFLKNLKSKKRRIEGVTEAKSDLLTPAAKKKIELRGSMLGKNINVRALIRKSSPEKQTPPINDDSREISAKMVADLDIKVQGFIAKSRNASLVGSHTHNQSLSSVIFQHSEKSSKRMENESNKKPKLCLIRLNQSCEGLRELTKINIKNEIQKQLSRNINMIPPIGKKYFSKPQSLNQTLESKPNDQKIKNNSTLQTERSDDLKGSLKEIDSPNKGSSFDVQTEQFSNFYELRPQITMQTILSQNSHLNRMATNNSNQKTFIDNNGKYKEAKIKFQTQHNEVAHSTIQKFNQDQRFNLLTNSPERSQLINVKIGLRDSKDQALKQQLLNYANLSPDKRNETLKKIYQKNLRNIWGEQLKEQKLLINIQKQSRNLLMHSKSVPNPD